MPNPPGSFVWYELITPDPDGAKGFYDALLGWDIEPEPTSQSGMDYRMIRSDGGNAGGVLRLTEEMATHGTPPIWLGYLNVEDVDATVAAAEEAGGAVMMPGFDVPGVGRIALIDDPQGAPVYVMRPTPPPGTPDAVSDVFSPDRIGRCAWNELSTSDPESARTFYRTLFGWRDEEFMDMGKMGKYRFIDHNGERIGALCGAMPGARPKWRYYFRVPSIGKAAEAIKAGGGAINMGPHEVPGGDHIIIGDDPQGAELALVGKA